jgi:hypothetical protein
LNNERKENYKGASRGISKNEYKLLKKFHYKVPTVRAFSPVAFSYFMDLWRQHPSACSRFHSEAKSLKT